MTLAEKLSKLRDEYECAVAKLQKEPNLCQRCKGWGKVGIAELVDPPSARWQWRRKEPDCELCGGTGKVRICNSCGSIH